MSVTRFVDQLRSKGHIAGKLIMIVHIAGKVEWCLYSHSVKGNHETVVNQGPIRH